MYLANNNNIQINYTIYKKHNNRIFGVLWPRARV